MSELTHVEPLTSRAGSPCHGAHRFLPPARHRAYPLLAALLTLVALARAGSTVRTFNHTTDELSHIAGAVGLYETGRNLYMVEHPPLQRLLVGGVLKAIGVRYPPARGLAEIPARNESNAAGAEIAFKGPVDYWTLLAAARLANLPFAAALLVYVYLLGRYLANPLAGLLALALVSTDPTVLGHAALVTTDVPAAAGFLAATYHALRFAARPTWPRSVAAGAALGLALACKFTCVLLVPGVLLLIAIRAALHARRRNVQRGTFNFQLFRHHLPRLRYLAAIPALAFLVLWATYLFDVGRLADQDLFHDEKTWQRIPQWVKRVPIPMPSMALGLMFMSALGKAGFPCYFNGQLGLKGHLLYFPEAVALKTPVAVVVALALATLAVLAGSRPARTPAPAPTPSDTRQARGWQSLGSSRSHRVRHLLPLLCLALPPSLLLLTAMAGKLQIGIRHILPVLPFLYLFIALALRGRRAVVLLPLILLAGLETARQHPDSLAFFNALAGGPRGGQKYLADSNLDWGQDVARLAAYLKSTGRRDYTIKVSGARVAALVEYLGLDPKSRDTDPDDLRRNPRGLLAIGVNAKLGLEDFRRNPDGSATRGPDYSWLNAYPVIARIGRSIEVYDLDARPKR